MRIRDTELAMPNGQPAGTLFKAAQSLCDMVSRPQADMASTKEQVKLGERFAENMLESRGRER